MKNLEKMKKSSDYPYGYAYDYIRNTVNEKIISRENAEEVVKFVFPKESDRNRILTLIADHYILLYSITQFFDEVAKKINSERDS